MEQLNWESVIEYEEEYIKELLEKKDYQKLREYINEMHYIDISEIISNLDNHAEAILLFRMLKPENASQVFSFIDMERQVNFITSLKEDEIKSIMEELYFDDIIDLIGEMPPEFVIKVLRNISKEERELVNEFLGYPKDSAGSIMTIEYVALYRNYTVEDSLSHIYEVGMKKETIYSTYVVDSNSNLQGIVSLRKLVTSDPKTRIADIMERDFISLNTHDDQERIAEVFRKYGFLAIPVLDDRGKLVGIVTYDEVYDILEDETTEDFEKMASVIPSERPYLEEKPKALAFARLPWILVLMISATITGFIISFNLEILGQFAVLSSLIPMLTDTGGNAASQSSTLIIRGIATGEIDSKDSIKIFFKEVKISAIIAAVLTIVAMIRVVVLGGESVRVALTVASTLIFTVFLSNIIGSLLPIGAKKLGLDPAVMAVPVITTSVDALSLIIYFAFARLYLL